MLFSQSTFRSASVLGAAATVAMLSVAPVQAAVITGVANITGVAEFDKFNASPITDTIDFSDEKVIASSTGSFASLIGTSVNVSTVTLSAILSTPLDKTDYNGSAPNPLLTFSNGLIFNVNNPFPVTRERSSAGVVATSFPEFTGTFILNGETIGRGFITANQIRGEDGSFSMSVQAVPEPLTMLGAGAAIAFGAGFKRRLAQKNDKSQAKS